MGCGGWHVHHQRFLQTSCFTEWLATVRALFGKGCSDDWCFLWGGGGWGGRVPCEHPPGDRASPGVQGPCWAPEGASIPRGGPARVCVKSASSPSCHSCIQQQEPTPRHQTLRIQLDTTILQAYPVEPRRLNGRIFACSLSACACSQSMHRRIKTAGWMGPFRDEMR